MYLHCISSLDSSSIAFSLVRVSASRTWCWTAIESIEKVLHYYNKQAIYVAKQVYQGSLSGIQSRSTTPRSVPICRVISSCLVIGRCSKWLKRFPSKMPLERGFETKSLRTMLYGIGKSGSIRRYVRYMRTSTYRNAFGFRPATCWMFRVSCPCNSWNLLAADSSTAVRDDIEPLVAPRMQSVRYPSHQDR